MASKNKFAKKIHAVRKAVVKTVRNVTKDKPMSPKLSQRLLEGLHNELVAHQRSLEVIAKNIGTNVSYLKKVANGEKGFTVKHLENIRKNYSFFYPYGFLIYISDEFSAKMIEKGKEIKIGLVDKSKSVKEIGKHFVVNHSRKASEVFVRLFEHLL